MVRRSVPAKKIDDVAFPIRVKVKVPARGFGLRIDLYHAWLRDNLSPRQWAHHSVGGASGFYFRSLQTAERFLATFPELELADTVASDRAY
jgi:hypothetical protein